jgi:hypothetical protein
MPQLLIYSFSEGEFRIPLHLKYAREMEKLLLGKPGEHIGGIY